MPAEGAEKVGPAGRRPGRFGPGPGGRAPAYLTAQAWSKRQEVNGLALRYVLTLTGLPVDEPKGEGSSDEIPMAVETAPGHTTTTVGKKLLDAHFGGSAPRSQVEEVRA